MTKIDPKITSPARAKEAGQNATADDMEDLSAMTFEACEINLDAIPSNAKWREIADSEIVTLRLAALICTKNDKELEQMVRGDDCDDSSEGSAEIFVDLLYPSGKGR